MLPLARTPGRRVLLLTALTTLLAPLMLLGCQPIVRPTDAPLPTLNLVGTVTALAVPAAATQTAISDAGTQVAQLQATGTALVDAQTAVAGQTAVAQGASATQAAAAGAASAQAATSTALAQAAAAQAATATALAQQVAAQAGTATALAKIVPAATSTLVPPSPTPVPPTPPCVTVDPALKSIATKAANAGLNIGCPTQPATTTTNGALQEYWANVGDPNPNTHLRSLMIWYGDVRTIYVIVGSDTAASQGSLLSYSDTWQEGEPDIMPACVPFVTPAGYLAPVRGFGKVWCANRLVGTVGWPKNQETAARLLVQTTPTGLLLKISAPDQNAGYLAALDYRAVRAVTTNVGP